MCVFFKIRARCLTCTLCCFSFLSKIYQSFYVRTFGAPQNFCPARSGSVYVRAGGVCVWGGGSLNPHHALARLKKINKILATYLVLPPRDLIFSCTHVLGFVRVRAGASVQRTHRFVFDVRKVCRPDCTPLTTSTTELTTKYRNL